MEKSDQFVEVAELESGERMLKFFRFAHLPDHLATKSETFARVAVSIVREYPKNAERTVALRKLLEAKDCAVRSLLEG